MPELGERSVLDTIAVRGTEPIFAMVDRLRSWTPRAELPEEAAPADRP